MAWHGLTVMRDQNSILLRGEAKHFGVRDSFELGVVRRQKVQCWFAPPTSFYDHVIEVGVRKEANHPLSSRRRNLPPHALEFFFDVRRRRVSLGVGILRQPALFHHLLHFVFVVQVEGERSVDLVQAQRRIVRPDSFRIFPISVLPNDAIDGHTATDDIKAGFPPFYVVVHGRACFQFSANLGRR